MNPHPLFSLLLAFLLALLLAGLAAAGGSGPAIAPRLAPPAPLNISPHPPTHLWLPLVSRTTN